MPCSVAGEGMLRTVDRNTAGVSFPGFGDSTADTLCAMLCSVAAVVIDPVGNEVGRDAASADNVGVSRTAGALSSDVGP